MKKKNTTKIDIVQPIKKENERDVLVNNLKKIIRYENIIINMY